MKVLRGVLFLIIGCVLVYFFLGLSSLRSSLSEVRSDYKDLSQKVFQITLDFHKFETQSQVMFEWLRRTLDLLRERQEENISEDYDVYSLSMINVRVINLTLGSEGSGITLEYKNKFYILSAGHLISDPQEILLLKEGDIIIGKLKVIKWDPEVDLLLLQPEDPDLVPKYSAVLADKEPPQGSKILIIGNPLGYEDLFSEGRVVKYYSHIMMFYDHVYFGSSGGGVFNPQGELVGIISFLSYSPTYPPFVLYGGVRLSVIQKFLSGVE